MSQSTLDSDSKLILSLQKGDQVAFEKIFNKYSPKLYFFALRYLHIESEAEDIVQKVFISLWENRQSLDASLSIQSYLHKATVNHVYNYFKHQAIRHKHVEYVLKHERQEDESSLDPIYLDDLTKNIELLLGQLPQIHQKIFKMSRWEGLSHEEIAQRLGLSVRSVESYIYRCIKYFKDNLKEPYCI